MGNAPPPLLTFPSPPFPFPFTKLWGPRMDLHLRPQFTHHGGTKMRSLVFEEEERRSTLWLLSSRLESSGEKRFRERESLLASRLENCAFFELYIFFFSYSSLYRWIQRIISYYIVNWKIIGKFLFIQNVSKIVIIQSWFLKLIWNNVNNVEYNFFIYPAFAYTNYGIVVQ